MTEEPGGHGVRRMCIAFDLERYSRGTDAAQIEKQRAMAGLVREASERGALERAHWLRQEQGDGELALLPPGIDEARLVTSLWREFREGLHRYNRHANAEARLRMRVAAHEGMTYVADNGFAGTAINTVCRLRDCQAAKDALSGTRSDLVLIVSDRIYHDVISGHDALDLPARAFAETAVDMPDKGFRATAYIFSGDGVLPDTPAGAESIPGMARMPQPAGGTGARGEAGTRAGGDGRDGGTSISIGPNATIRGGVAGTMHNWHD